MLSKVLLLVHLSIAAGASAAEPHSPLAVTVSPDGTRFAVSDATAASAALVAADGTLIRTIPLHGQPAGSAWSPDGRILLIAERSAGTLAEIDPATGQVQRRLKAGRYVIDTAVTDDRILALDNGLHRLDILDRISGQVLAQVPCVYRPWRLALSPDRSRAVVCNLQPLCDARQAPEARAMLTVIDVKVGSRLADISLPVGAINVHGAAISPDGKWAYVVHSLGRFTLPTTQIERGWVMTHALSLIDLERLRHQATVLLDQISEGAADPWGIALSADGGTAWVTLSGVSQVARIDLATLHQLLSGKAPKTVMSGIPANLIWHRLAADPQQIQDLSNDLAALYGAGLIKRLPLTGSGLRGVAWSPANQGVLAVCAYFSGDLLLCDPTTLAIRARVVLGPQPGEDPVRQGEALFFDARQCFQHWMSCASCHPEGRADGLNWDLLNDGLGNPKNTKSLVLSHRTPPMMATGVRESMEMATQKGFMVIQFRTIEETQLEQVRSYIRSLPVEPSPHLVMEAGRKLACMVCHPQPPKTETLPKGHRSIEGALSPQAERGSKLFRDPKVGCATCHPGPLFTDLKMYDVGTGTEQGQRFDTPTCYDLWRTAPFLHDGSSPTVLHMLTTRNQGDKHGRTSQLSPEELQALAAFLESL